MKSLINLIRSYIYSVWFALSILFVGSIGAIFVAINKKFALKVTEIWAKSELFGLKYIMGIDIEIRGLENLQKAGPCIIAGKHLSTLDTIAPFVMTKYPAFVFKKELFKIPIFGWYLKVAGMIGIDRDGGMAALKGMVAEAKERMSDGRSIVIFPEGTRQTLNATPDYKPGVAAIYGMIGTACVPLALNTGYYWPAHGIKKQSGKVIFEFLEPIEAGLKRQDFMNRLESAIETKTKELIEEARNS